LLYPAVRILSGAGQDKRACSTTTLKKVGKVKSLESLLLEEPGSEFGDLSCSISGGLEVIAKSIEEPIVKSAEKPVAVAVPDQFGSGQCKNQDSPVASGADESVRTPASTTQTGLPVYLHVYDITHEGKIEELNSLLAPRLSPLKLGGFFHAGIEVNGREWSFGYCTLGSGVCGLEPRTHPSHHFRETISLPSTKLSEERIAGIIKAMSSEYQGCDYSLLRRNCIHFADDFCHRLGVGGMPLWVHRLARTAEWLCDGLLRISQIFEDKDGPEGPLARL